MIEGRLVEAAALTRRRPHRRPEALARLDDSSRAQILGDSVVRVKLWARDGTILYSDEPRADRRAFALGRGRAGAVRDAAAPTPSSATCRSPRTATSARRASCWRRTRSIRTPERHPGAVRDLPALQRRSTRPRRRLLGALAPPLIGGLLVLLLFQVPLAWSLARRLQRGHEERERLLAGAIEASDRERRRIAADLHDGVVQDLAGVAFGLAPLAADARRRGDDEEARVLRRCRRHAAPRCAGPAHAAGRDPPAAAGVRGPGARARRPAEPAAGAGDRDAPRRRRGRAAHDALVYRVAREALRNVAAHAEACTCRGRPSRPTTAHRRRRRPRVRRRPARRRARGGPRRARRCSTTSSRRPGGELDVDSAPGRGHDRRAGGARDDPRPARRRPRRDPRRPRPADRRRSTDVELVGTAADGAEAVEQAARARARRRADGPRHAARGRDRGDARGSSPSSRDERCSC